MNGGRKRRRPHGGCFSSLCRSFLQLVGRGGPVFVSLSFSRPPHLSIHPSVLRLGCATMAWNICGYQVITAEPKQRGSAAPTSSGTPQLAPAAPSPPRSPRWPAYYLCEERRETDESAEGWKDRWVISQGHQRRQMRTPKLFSLWPSLGVFWHSFNQIYLHLAVLQLSNNVFWTSENPVAHRKWCHGRGGREGNASDVQVFGRATASVKKELQNLLIRQDWVEGSGHGVLCGSVGSERMLVKVRARLSSSLIALWTMASVWKANGSLRLR